MPLTAHRSALFSVRDDDPFIVFQKLQNIARRSRGDADVIDLSRGDPGYGFTPSVRGREFSSFVLFLDAALNRTTDDRFLQYGEADLPSVLRRIEEVTRGTFQAQAAEKLLGLLREFLAHAKACAAGEGKTWSDFAVLRHLFSYSAMSGGSYLNPQGEELTRVIVAGWHRAELGVNVRSTDLILTSGASHAIGSLFKALCDEGCRFFRAGDSVCIASPVYAPYHRILEERKLETQLLGIDPLTGSIARQDIDALRKAEPAPKALFLIGPHNPTGFSFREEDLRELAGIARERNMLVITDEVYVSFFPEKRSMLALVPERTICINARSKIERSTGLRFGEIIVLPEGRETIPRLLGLPGAEAFWRLLVFAKAPGKAGGQFQHTTFVPGPSQLLGIAHIVLGGAERETYLAGLDRNHDAFSRGLSLPHRGNLYYVIFDFDALPGCSTQALTMEERLTKLAEAGVIYLPAYRFFAPRDRIRPGVLTSVRASTANTTAPRLKEAARRTKAVLC